MSYPTGSVVAFSDRQLSVASEKLTEFSAIWRCYEGSTPAWTPDAQRKPGQLVQNPNRPRQVLLGPV